MSEQHPSLYRRLLIGGAASVIIAAAAAAFAVADRTTNRAEEAQAELLEEVAGVVARVEAGRHRPAALSMDEESFAEAFIAPQGMTPAGSVVLVRMLREGGAALRIVLEESLPDGAHTIEIDGALWRVHILTLKTGRHVAVAQPLAALEQVRRDAVAQAVLPVILAALAILGMGAVVFATATRPMRRLAAEIDARSPVSNEPLAADGVPSEVMPLVAAINDLLARVEVLRRREARFAADAAHELRTPVTALKLEADRLCRLAKTPEGKALAGRLADGMERLTRLVSQLLTFQRSQLDDAGADKRSQADLLNALGDAVALVWPEIEARRMDFEAVGFELLEDDPVRLPVTQEALTGLFRNLLENAVRYGSEEGRIRVLLESRLPLRIAVCDSGPGIPEIERERVFDPFYRVAGSSVSGTGLGLAIVREIAQKAGLSVRLEDASPGLRVVLEAKNEEAEKNLSFA